MLNFDERLQQLKDTERVKFSAAAYAKNKVAVTIKNDGHFKCREQLILENLGSSVRYSGQRGYYIVSIAQAEKFSKRINDV